MQVYVHRDGHNLGPYSIGQLRSHLKGENFTWDDLACVDGVNWIALKDVPGMIEQTSKPASQAGITPQEQLARPGKKILIFLVVVFCVIFLLTATAYFGFKNEESAPETSTLTASERLGATRQSSVATLTSGEESELTNSKPLATTGSLQITGKQVVEVYDGDTFKIDLIGVHPLFGDDLPIRVKGIDTPELRGTTDEVKALAEQARELTENTLKGAKKIELRSPQRGKYFRIVAEVWVDGKALDSMLKEKGLAKDYDGEGERPKW